MKNIKKLIIPLFFYIMSILFIAQLSVSAEELSGSCGADVTWHYDGNGTLTVSGSGAINNYGIYDRTPWLSANLAYEITRVKIEDGVTSIGDYAFYYLATLESVEIPDSVESIGTAAFQQCTELTSVSIPDSVTVIKESTFRSCSKLSEVELPANLLSIEKGAFWDCGYLNLTLPDFVVSLGQSCFASSKIESISISDGVKVIPDMAFDGCSKLISVDLGNGVEKIGRYAFSNCLALKSLKFPKSIKSVDEHAFSSVILSEFHIEDYYHFLLIEYANEGSKPYKISTKIYVNGELTVTLVIPDTITEIKDRAFINLNTIEQVIIPDSVVSIGERAFYGCENLKGVIIGSGVKSIGTMAFGECISLESIDIPDNVTTLGDSIFSGCMKLKTVSIGKGVYAIPANAFSNCQSLKNLYLSEGLREIHRAFNYAKFYTITVPKSVTYISPDIKLDIHRIECYEGSYAHNFAANNGISYTFLCEHIIPETGEWHVIREATYAFEGTKALLCPKCNEPVVFEAIPIPEYNGYADVNEQAWYARGIEYCSKKGYLAGIANNKFDPEGKLTREQFVVILARFAGADLANLSTPYVFNDVSLESWYGPAVYWARKYDYVFGITDWKFGVGQTVTREQIATMLYRYARINGMNIEISSDKLSDFTDEATVSDWAREASAWAVEVGLLGSTSTTKMTLSPKMSVTRGQIAKIFMSFDALQTEVNPE